VFSAAGPLDRISQDVTSLFKHPEKLIDFHDPEQTMRAWTRAARVAATAGGPYAAPAVMLNAIQPLIGMYKNLQVPDDEK